jgi:flagellar protein FlaG
MNEIPKTASTTPIRPVSVSAVVVGNTRQAGGQDVQVAEQASKAQHVDVKQMQDHVEAAVAQMNEYIQSTQRDLHFSYDKASGETVVKVLDRSTQEVIRQIPDETFLKLAHSKDADGNFQLFSAQA